MVVEGGRDLELAKVLLGVYTDKEGKGGGERLSQWLLRQHETERVMGKRVRRRVLAVRKRRVLFHGINPDFDPMVLGFLSVSR